jgi:hypothetical protein
MEKRLEQMGIDCIEVIGRAKPGKNVSRDEYYLALMDLHKKYPIPGHEPPLTPFQLANYHDITTVMKDARTGIEYLDHLYPLNFRESAEMFVRHWERLDKEKPPRTIKLKREVRDKKMESTGEHEEEVPF